MRKKVSIILLILLLLITLLGGCSNGNSSSSTSQESSTKKETSAEESKGYSIKYLRMSSGSQGANWYTIGAAMTTLASEEMGISTSNSPGGAVANVKSVNNGEYELGWAFTSTTYDAYKGVNSFDGEKPMENLRHVMSLFPSYAHNIVREDSKINDFSDLADKKINFLPNTETSHVVITEILKEYGITPETVAENGGVALEVRISDASELLKNSQLDFWTFTTSAPASSVSELAFQPGIRFLQLKGEKRDAILENLPGFAAMQIPAGTYDKQTEAVETIGTTTQIFANANVPEEVIYDFLSLMYEKWDGIVEVNPTAMKEAIPENWLRGNAIPIHPGAEKFYKEKGLIK